MTQFAQKRTISAQTRLATTYYGWLGVDPSASPVEIRRAYRELSKQYHPDTTELPGDVATQKFQQLNEAYATLSSPERRMLYDAKIGYSRVNVLQAPLDLDEVSSSPWTGSAYLDPHDRPLSAGEIFALFILGVTFLACLLLAIALGLAQGNATLPLPEVSPMILPQLLMILSLNLL
ncbi:J domain-containing protein [Spirulina subsalsa FACHB-351]|uniref:J domain-containing protein n=1 Tax=Spirulina subsalsa FACHB-351 TaxID=234711 RepID=A0ABT3L7X9_9CYAN|nr:J domain-containing protein [Spirulina subsalsa]MCW6037611.1 J domain-containing protein [Spirulina subsalsa FACHB-351]